MGVGSDLTMLVVCTAITDNVASGCIEEIRVICDSDVSRTQDIVSLYSRGDLDLVLGIITNMSISFSIITLLLFIRY